MLLTEAASTRPRINLLGGFTLHLADRLVTLPLHASRVLAYLCLDRLGRPASARHQVAERLWSDVPAERAHASLRTALWRIRRADRRVVVVDRDWVRLGDVDVDVHRGRAQATRLLSDDPVLRPADTHVTALVGDLLPGWDEDWLLLERERIRQLQTHALEALAARLCRMGCFLQAIDVAYAVIEAEPLRESGHVALIDTYLAEGSVAQTHQQAAPVRDTAGQRTGLVSVAEAARPRRRRDRHLPERVGDRRYHDVRCVGIHVRNLLWEWDMDDVDQLTQSGSTSIDLAPNVSLADIYVQALTSMRATDDISLRLLAAVPFVSGIGIALLARQPSDAFPATPRFFVSIFAAIVTLAIYRWERRNMSHCRRLRTWAAQVEYAYLSGLSTEAGKALSAPPHDDNLSGKFVSRTWGKTQAELLLYMTAIVTALKTRPFRVGLSGLGVDDHGRETILVTRPLRCWM